MLLGGFGGGIVASSSAQRVPAEMGPKIADAGYRNGNFSPVPPRENRLDVAIPAGERLGGPAK